MIDSMNEFYDACVIGAGPAGITAALDLAERGATVVLVESGSELYDKATQSLSDAEISTQGSQSPMDEAVRRGLGGTSALWGGRCVPLDVIDYERRDFVDYSGWPLEASLLAPYYSRACEILGVGDASFETTACSRLNTVGLPLSAKFVNSDSILGTHLERWSRASNIWQAHKNKIKGQSRITVLPGMTCVGFRQAHIDGPVAEILIQSSSSPNAETKSIRAQTYIVAAGGVESTRLILNSLLDPLGLKLHSSELVGRYYMGHPSGKIADIELFGDPAQTQFGFERDGNVYVRRRITFTSDMLRREKLLNIAFWLDNPTLSDWQHGSGVLSAAYLALTAPVLGDFLAPTAIRKRIGGESAEQRMRHLMNCLRTPVATSLFCLQFI